MHPGETSKKKLSAVPDRESVGARLRELRKRQRLTLKGLSARSGVALSTLSKMELGQVSASYGKLAAVARALSVDMGELFGGAAAAEQDGPLFVRSPLASAPRYDAVAEAPVSRRRA